MNSGSWVKFNDLITALMMRSDWIVVTWLSTSEESIGASCENGSGRRATLRRISMITSAEAEYQGVAVKR